MLNLPDNLKAESFLREYWQKRPLAIPAALRRLRPAISRNELGWLATLDDVESRIVFVDRSNDSVSYHVETGPFDVDYLSELPKHDWTLLVHDVEKHIPAMRALFNAVPFIPDWRIDDLMVSFAAPGGGVGPHLDNYDVFLCQGTGVRDWLYTESDVSQDTNASNDIALLAEFEGTSFRCSQGDVLYLPPGVAHWGTAKRACLTYSIGMRAPLIADLARLMGLSMSDEEVFYSDPDLALTEVSAGYISPQAARRVVKGLGLSKTQMPNAAIALGRLSTQTKDWLRPECPTQTELEYVSANWAEGTSLTVHGMARIAFDEKHVYVNGDFTPYPDVVRSFLEDLTQHRVAAFPAGRDNATMDAVHWMAAQGAFDLDGSC